MVGFIETNKYLKRFAFVVVFVIAAAVIVIIVHMGILFFLSLFVISIVFAASFAFDPKFFGECEHQKMCANKITITL